MTHPADTVDTVLATHREGVVRHGGHFIDAEAAFYRVDGAGNVINFAITSGLQFKTNDGVGVESARPVGLHMAGDVGEIDTKGGAITFFAPGVTGVRYDDRDATVIDRGVNWVRVNLPAGRYGVTLTFDPIDPPARPRLSIEDARVDEGAGPVTLRVRLSEAASSPITVLVASAPGSAVNGEDFYGISRSIRFATGDDEQRVEVSILNDSDVEATESFVVRLIHSDGADIERGRASVTIVDDDRESPVLSIAPLTVNENASIARLSITLDQAASEAVRFSIATAAESALPGRDYTGIYRILEIPPGQRRLTTDVRILNDTQSEPNETFRARLFAPIGATISAQNRIATIAIEDDD